MRAWMSGVICTFSSSTSTSTSVKPRPFTVRNWRTFPRDWPSTSIFSWPFGILRSSRILAIVPTWKMSFSWGSSVSASFWEATKTRCCKAIASSRALTLFVRDTSNGTTMCGNTTRSRTGSKGSLLGNLLFFLVLQDWRVDFLNHFVIHGAAQHILLVRKFIHDVQKHFLNDRPQAPGAGATSEGQLRNGMKRVGPNV